MFVNLALAKYLSRIETDFTKPRSQLIAAGIVLLPAVITIAQNETGLALVFFAFFLVMFREGLPAGYLIIGFSFAVLVVATLLVEKNTLAIILTAIALLAMYLMRKQVRRRREIFIMIALIWLVCVGIQRFAVPFLFYKSSRKPPGGTNFFIDWSGKSVCQREHCWECRRIHCLKKKDVDYNVRQSKIAIGSGGFLGRGFLKGTQTRFDFVPEQRHGFYFLYDRRGLWIRGQCCFFGFVPISAVADN